MNNSNYTQPDSRDVLSQLIDLFSPIMTSQAESFLRSISANTYSRDFATIMDLLNDKTWYVYINEKTLENAAEYYKQLNKSLLCFRNLTASEKLRESNEIDTEAIRLKNDWTQKLRQKGISIIC